MPHHPPIIERPSDSNADLETAATVELCKAVDHVREALSLCTNSETERRTRLTLRELKSIIHNASNGRIEP